MKTITSHPRENGYDQSPVREIEKINEKKQENKI